ncbi:MAG: efflux RND transporter permease subunit [Brevinematales bacterium]
MNEFVKTHIRHIRSFLLLYFLILIAGFFSSFMLKFSSSSEVEPLMLSIRTKYYGKDADFIERTITIPIENALSQVKGIKDINSISEDGQSLINVWFYPGEDIKRRSIEIKSLVDNISVNFPSDVQEPVVSRYNPEDSPLIVVGFINKDNNLVYVRNWVEKNFLPSLKKVDGVADARVTGGRQVEILCSIKDRSLFIKALSSDNVARYIGENNFIFSFFKNSGSFENAYMFDMKLNTPEKLFSANILDIPARELFSIEYTNREPDEILRYNGKEWVAVYVYREKGQNMLEVFHNVNQLIKKIKLEPDMQMKILFNQTEDVNKSLRDFFVSALISIISIGIVVYIFFSNLVNAFFINIIIPLSLMLTFTFVVLFNIEINALILSGLALSSGMVVDNVLVIFESYNSGKKYNNFLRKLYVQTLKVKNPLFISLVTTLSSFIPLVLGNEIIKTQYLNFVIVISIILFFSFVISMGIVPLFFYVSYLNNWKLHILNENKILIEKIKKYIFNFFYFFIKKEKLVKQLVLFVVIFCPIGFWLIFQRPYSVPYIKEINAVLEFPSGTSLDYTSEVSQKVEDGIMSFSFVEDIISKVEKSHVSYIIKLKKPLNMNFVMKNFESKNLVKEYNNVSLIFDFSQERKSKKREIDVLVLSENLEKLPEVTKFIASEIYSSIQLKDIIFHFKEGLPVYQLGVNYNYIWENGWSLPEITSHLRILFFGIIPSKFSSSSGLIDIRLKGNINFTNYNQMKEIIFNDKNQKTAYFSQFFDIEKTKVMPRIYHNNKRRSLSFSVRLNDNQNIYKLKELIEKKLKSIKLPPSFYLEVGNKLKEEQAFDRELFAIIFIAVYVVMAVMVFIYQNVKNSFLIFISIPFSFAGSVLLNLLLHIDFNQFVFLALIFLSGTTVNSSILIYESIAEERGKRGLKRLFNAIKEKSISLITTNITTIAGILPFIFLGKGSQWFDFAVTMLGGLVFGFFYAMFFLPILLKNS